MRILVIGAYGLVGGYVTARLLGEGHEVVGLGRETSVARRRFPKARWVDADLRDMNADRWAALLGSIDAVVNCAGALQDSPRDDLRGVHVRAVTELARACEQHGVRRFVHISAVGVERGEGRFQYTKHEAEAALRATNLDWIILRPGLVLAPAAYGGSALLRGLSAFPFAIPAIRPDAIVQVISVDDVALAVVRALVVPTARFTCDLVSAERTSLGDILRAFRSWLGLPDARVIAAPTWVAAAVAMVADGLAWLGWRSPMRTAAMRQLAGGVTGDSDAANSRLSLSPRGLVETLSSWPSGVQERWFAHLYFLKPTMLATLAAFWAVSGVVGFASHDRAAGLLTGAGIPAGLADAFVVGGSILDLSLAFLVSIRATAPLALRAMIVVTAGYLSAASVWVPDLWADPMGPLVKSVPAAVLALVSLAVMDER
ncbi:SDR family oxidoreductase [Hyphomicrobium sp.]|uniref:SDR family oxidoreductase n=1 Tax=Hyphomicrobium sp. TaxID=82 RepID=UPI000FBD2D04|nr:SDR family oxidoreductase [Hyphomicrobium sp.]RUP08897.1 MAG: SDR family oxidoreductase [Hyphomicrobium sp.]